MEPTLRAPTAGGFTALPTGTVLDRYRIEHVIAAGGFGITYACKHTTLDKPYALKEHFPRQFAYREAATSEVRPTDPDTFTWALDRFIQEGRSLAQCHHPNVVSVADVFEANSTAYMVLGYEQGQSLKNWAASLKRPPTQAEIDGILLPLLDALAYVHGKGLLHRDIAPDNIMVRSDGSPCLIDFGAARQAVAERSQLMSAIIKSGYSPPEQYTRSGRSQGPWSDIYALGATLHWLVTGDAPQESTERQVDDDLSPLAGRADLGSSYRIPFLQGIDHALKLKYSERPQSVAAWRAILLGEPATGAATVQASPPRAPASFSDLPARPPAPTLKSPSTSVTLVAAAVLLLAIGTGWLMARTFNLLGPATSTSGQPVSRDTSGRIGNVSGASTSPKPDADSEARDRAALEEANRQAAETEARRRADEEARRTAEAEAKRKAEEEARVAAEIEARIKAETEQRLAAEEEARKKSEEEARLAAEAEAKRKAEEKSRAAAQQAAIRQQAEQERRRRQQEEERRAAAAEAAREARAQKSAPPQKTENSSGSACGKWSTCRALNWSSFQYKCGEKPAGC